MTAEADCKLLLEECEAKAIALIDAHNENIKLKQEITRLKREIHVLYATIDDKSV